MAWHHAIKHYYHTDWWFKISGGSMGFLILPFLGKYRIIHYMSLLKPTLNEFFFSINYFDRVIKEFPKLTNVLTNLAKGSEPEPLNDYMLTILSFNLAYNAFYRGKNRTAIYLLRSVLDSANLEDEVAISASLLEIQFCAVLRKPDLATVLISRLRLCSFWNSATDDDQDCLEFLSALVNRNDFALSSITDFNQKFHWFLYYTELGLKKTGDANTALSSLIKHRNALSDVSQRRLADNGIGCIIARYFKNYTLAETYFCSAMVKKNLSLDISNPGSSYTPILTYLLIYNTALTQLLAKKPFSALRLFLSVVPFIINGKIWLRIAESSFKIWRQKFDPNKIFDDPFRFRDFEDVIDEFRHSPNMLPICEPIPADNCPGVFAKFAIKHALLALKDPADNYIVPYLNSLENCLLRNPEVKVVQFSESVMPPCEDEFLIMYPSFIKPLQVQDERLKDEEWGRDKMFPLDKGITPRFNSTVTISSAPPSPREVRKKFTPDVPFSVVSASGYNPQSTPQSSLNTSQAVMDGYSPNNEMSFTRIYAIECLQKVLSGSAIALSKSDSNRLTHLLSEDPTIFSEVNIVDDFPKLIEFQPDIAAELLVYELITDANHLQRHLEVLFAMEFSVQVLVTVNKFISSCEMKELKIPEEFLNHFITICIELCEQNEDRNSLMVHRLVRMVCVFFTTLIRVKSFDVKPRLTEIQNFTMAYIALKEAHSLYQTIQQLKNSNN